MSAAVVTRVKHHKFAILLSYCGVGYWGLQRNKDVKTIEGDLFDALLKAELISEEQVERPQLFYFQRAARTDKGVSALKQILSAVLPANLPEKISLVNSYLDPKIRMVAAKRVTQRFDCKNYCDSRTYSYMMPTYALAHMDEKTTLDFRASKQHLDEFNSILSKYLGTHNFHNFTSQKAATDPSALRFILSIECSQPFVRKNIEFVVVRIKGQSFMIHQIRKMVGLAIGIQRGFAPEESLAKSFEFDKIDIPVAPGLGLLLEEIHYDKYNRKYGGNGIHEQLVWDQYADLIQKFADDYIYTVIVDTEVEQMSMLNWLQLLPIHTFGARDPGPPGESLEELYKSVNKADVYRNLSFNLDLLKKRKNELDEIEERREENEEEKEECKTVDSESTESKANDCEVLLNKEKGLKSEPNKRLKGENV